MRGKYWAAILVLCALMVNGWHMQGGQAVAAALPPTGVLALLPPYQAQGADSLRGVARVRYLNNLFKQYRNNDPEKAFQYALEALELAKTLNDLQGQAYALNNLGVFYRNRANYQRALDYYLQSMALHESTNNADGLANTLSNMGTLYGLMGEAEVALERYKEADSILQQSNRAKERVRSLSNIGNVYANMGNTAQSLDYYLQAYALFQSFEGESELFNPLTNLGNVFLRQSAYDTALYYFERSLALEKKSNNRYGQARVLNNIGLIYKNQNKLDLALANQQEALEIATALQDKSLLKLVYKEISETYFAQQDILTAYYYLDQHSRIKDALYKEESVRRLAELEFAHELEAQAKEIDLLDLKLRNVQNRTVLIVLVLVIVLLIGIGLATSYRRNLRLNQLLAKQNEEISRQNKAIEEARQKIEARNQTITDSIQYAEGLQNAILRRNDFRRMVKDAFVLYQPKDIVSGDFYWFYETPDYCILAVADCTGHGVAGAFMTVIGNALLNQLVREQGLDQPHHILTQMHSKLLETLQQERRDYATHGMDMAVCRIEFKKHTLQFASAKRPLYYFLNGELEIIKGDKQTLGEHTQLYGKPQTLTKQFTVHQLKYMPGSEFYLFSDGYVDQFGGPQGKKYLSKRFKAKLTEIQGLTMPEQGHILEKEILDWQGLQEQTDDRLVVGFRLH